MLHDNFKVFNPINKQKRTHIKYIFLLWLPVPTRRNEKLKLNALLILKNISPLYGN